MPQEIRIAIFAYLEPTELVRVSRVSKTFYKFCFDGQLWTSFNASEFYQNIPADSLARIIVAAGPFIKDLNLRGCVQVEHYRRTEAIVKACKNLMNATLEGCRNFQKTTLHNLLRSNERLVHLNLTGLYAVSNSACRIVAESCPQLESFNVSWCQKVDARGIKAVVDSCKRLKDLRAGEVKGFDNLATAESIFETNNLERLVLSGCADLTDEALKIMMHGVDPEIDILTDRPIAPPRKLRHLDVSRCNHLTSAGVKAIGYATPDLEGLQLSGCKTLTDEALEPILASTPRLTHLELEDLGELTNSVLSEHLVKAPCAASLEHLSLSYCENIGDLGVLPVMQTCTKLRSCDLDNTRISDLVLAAVDEQRVRRGDHLGRHEDGAVEVVRGAAGLDPALHGDGLVGRAVGHVDDGPAGEDGSGRVGLEELVHGLVVDDAEEQDAVALADGGGEIALVGGAGGDERLDVRAVGRAVPDGELEAGVEEGLGEGGAHVADAKDGYVLRGHDVVSQSFVV
ncbi:hypothetical protein NLG97_g600 [Lecanicillium saksenae]|uniref:Uncharacterized protein n=1 Tax=Lecanicillium saksenae TaxID=468837 RepID=A0ACC1R8R4_9HYPO|nr:hypothetical protein NLG97_g600 [Lecanicillium saksenae]